ncbi:hypothetical protein NPIL_39381 [Nephila pilipes]|uniref:Uncharacterized protein n=1 Tax=Nephila pilipes TaxID=299642 RepID=A0A8X6NLR6_NEPPI|nr:hypothetical protein NPIL_39381 [Nephila pilipes]
MVFQILKETGQIKKRLLFMTHSEIVQSLSTDIYDRQELQEELGKILHLPGRKEDDLIGEKANSTLAGKRREPDENIKGIEVHTARLQVEKMNLNSSSRRGLTA